MAINDPVILLDAVTGTVTGPVQGIQGQAVARPKGGLGLYQKPIEVFAALRGASPTSCTIVIETCDTLAGSYVTWATFALTAAVPRASRVGVMPNVRYIRARVTASSGTNAIDAYLVVRG